MLALPLPPLSGTFSCEHRGQPNVEDIGFLVKNEAKSLLFLPLELHTAIYLGSLHSFHTSAERVRIKRRMTEWEGLQGKTCGLCPCCNSQRYRQEMVERWENESLAATFRCISIILIIKSLESIVYKYKIKIYPAESALIYIILAFLLFHGK